MGVVKLSTAGIVNYQKYDDFLAGNAAFQPGGNAYEWLETTVLGSDTATVSFSNLTTSYSTTYEHLQIRGTGRDATANPYGAFGVRLNTDTDNNYARHQLVGDGSSVTSGASSSANIIGSFLQPVGDTGAADAYGAFIIDILDPFSTNKNTTLRCLTGRAGISGASEVRLTSGLWNNTASITDISIIGQLGNIMAGSRFSLYGLRSS